MHPIAFVCSARVGGGVGGLAGPPSEATPLQGDATAAAAPGEVDASKASDPVVLPAGLASTRRGRWGRKPPTVYASGGGGGSAVLGARCCMEIRKISGEVAGCTVTLPSSRLTVWIVKELGCDTSTPNCRFWKERMVRHGF